MMGQLNCQKEAEKEGPIMYNGTRMRIAKNRSNTMQNSIKMNLNFNQSSPIIEHTAPDYYGSCA